MGIFEFFSKAGYVIYLSVLWLICSVPIFTIGASTTAYCYMLKKVVWDKEGYATKGFFRAFRDNFKAATKVWMAFVVAISIIVMDYYIIVFLSGEYGGMYYAFIPPYILILFLLFGMLIYVFPYMANFDDNTKVTIKNSFLMSTRHFGYTICLMIIDVIIIIMALGFFLLLILIVPALIGFINTAVLEHVFMRYKTQQDVSADEK